MISRRTLAGSGLLAAALAVQACATPSAAAASGHRKATPLTPPNIVYIKFDDQDDHNRMDLMPNLRQLGNDGLRMLNSFVDTSSCGPSRVSTLTGLASDHHGLRGDSNQHGGFGMYNSVYGCRSLPMALKAANYATSIVGRLMTDMHDDSPLPQGFDDVHVLLQGFAYRKFSMNDNGVVSIYPKAQYQTDVLETHALNFIAAQTPAKPFALFLWTGAPHGSRYLDIDDAPEPHPDDLAADVGNQPQGGAFNEADMSDKPHGTVGDLPLLDPAVANTIWQLRHRSMLRVDRMIAAVRAACPPNTIIIVDADNGYSEGAHRLEEKIKVYDADQRVPLFIWWPEAIPAGQQRTELVNTLDVSATIYDLAAATPMLPQDGQSLRPLLGGGAAPWRDAMLVQNSVTKGMRTATDFYAETLTPEFGLEREYYLYSVDPLEMRNRIGNRGAGPVKPEDTTRVADLSARLAARLAA